MINGFHREKFYSSTKSCFVLLEKFKAPFPLFLLFEPLVLDSICACILLIEVFWDLLLNVIWCIAHRSEIKSLFYRNEKEAICLPGREGGREEGGREMVLSVNLSLPVILFIFYYSRKHDHLKGNNLFL